MQTTNGKSSINHIFEKTHLHFIKKQKLSTSPSSENEFNTPRMLGSRVNMVAIGHVDNNLQFCYII